MTFEELSKITDDSELVSKTYEIFNEDEHLNCSQTARMEFLTTIRYIEKYLKPGNRILEVTICCLSVRNYNIRYTISLKYL